MCPGLFVSMHGWTWTVGMTVGFLSTQSSHAGFDVDGRFHDLHHQLFNYNFGNFGVLDTWCGTRVTAAEATALAAAARDPLAQGALKGRA
jgi:sterol desaturase/sphingolipid hydroxylase (fatty acid hydroxylase superfamily)